MTWLYFLGLIKEEHILYINPKLENDKNLNHKFTINIKK